MNESKDKKAEDGISELEQKLEESERLLDGRPVTDSGAEVPRLQRLMEICLGLSSTLELENLLQLVLKNALEVSCTERGFLMLFDHQRKLEVRAFNGIDRRTINGEEFSFSRSVVNRVAETGERVCLDNVSNDEYFSQQASIVDLGLQTIFCLPLKIKGAQIGLVYADSQSPACAVEDIDLTLLEAFASQAAVAIENARLHQESIVDSLTQLYNYGYLMMRIDEELNRKIRITGFLSLMMIDVDRFKDINDTFGHHIGSQVLREISALLKKTVRKIDIPARYGGDEFAVLMPETTVAGAERLAERVRRAVEDSSFHTDGRRVTLSVGIASLPVERIEKREALIMEADHALYLSKGKGGNCVTLHVYQGQETALTEPLLGKCGEMQKVFSLMGKAAHSDIAVLLTGETGTGKELLTRTIHRLSPKGNAPFVAVNCAAIPDALLESELFGHEKGSFTGAYALQKGKFELAQGGTIYLDEVEELPMSLQAKLLRVLESGEIERVGGSKPIPMEARIIASSNKDLAAEIEKKTFRKDLYYRLTGLEITLPPLRERGDDSVLLAEHFLKEYNQRYHKTLKMSSEACQAILSYDWPGNVRELKHRLEKAVIIAENVEEVITAESLGLQKDILGIAPDENMSGRLKDIRKIKDQKEKDLIVKTLSENGWNVVNSAKALGVTRQHLYRLIKTYQLKKYPKTNL